MGHSGTQVVKTLASADFAVVPTTASRITLSSVCFVAVAVCPANGPHYLFVRELTGVANLKDVVMNRRFRAGHRRPVVLVGFLGAVVLVVLLAVGIKSSPKPRMGPVRAGDSKGNCIDLPFADGVLNQSAITAVTNLTGVEYNCLTTFANAMPTWAGWESPWMFFNVSDGWDAWLNASPARQVVMSMDLIPKAVSNIHDPLTWEQLCAAGDYNQHATTLAQNLVSYGAGGIVIRLGTEANGDWEANYVGTTSAEMSDWSKCYDNEVSAMRAVQGRISCSFGTRMPAPLISRLTNGIQEIPMSIS